MITIFQAQQSKWPRTAGCQNRRNSRQYHELYPRPFRGRPTIGLVFPITPGCARTNSGVRSKLTGKPPLRLRGHLRGEQAPPWKNSADFPLRQRLLQCDPNNYVMASEWNLKKESCVKCARQRNAGCDCAQIRAKQPLRCSTGSLHGSNQAWSILDFNFAAAAPPFLCDGHVHLLRAVRQDCPAHSITIVERKAALGE
jgi:hypothetical protein